MTEPMLATKLPVRCPALADLPPPPNGRSGWPWTVETPALPPARADGSPWPRISIVTPSYNQGPYIEETIRSILLQGYPDLEYIVMDGASTDETVEVLKKYEPWIASWVSEKDAGQADAINKGLARCTGEVFQFINSDDYLAPRALEVVGGRFAGGGCVAGQVLNFDDEGPQVLRRNANLSAIDFLRRPPAFCFHQPGVWLAARNARQLGGFDTSLRYKFDLEFLVRYLERWPSVEYVDEVLVNFRWHRGSKTKSEGEAFWNEEMRARELLAERLAPGPARAAFTAYVRKRRWRLRIEEIRQDGAVSRWRALGRLCGEALRDPLNRLDRYAFGAIRRVFAQAARGALTGGRR